MIASGRCTSPRSFQTRTLMPSARPRARASSGCISSGGVRVAGRQAAEGRRDALVRRGRDQDQRIGRRRTGRKSGSRAPYLLLEVRRGQLDLARRRLREHVLEQDRVLAADGHRQPRDPAGCALGRTPPRRGSAGSTASSISSASLAREGGIVEAEARGEPAEDLGVGQRLALRRDHRRRALEPVRAVGGVEVVRTRSGSTPAARRPRRPGCPSSPRRTPTMKRSSRARPRRIRFWSGCTMTGLWL